MSRPTRRGELLARPRWFCGAPECPALYYGADGSWAGTDAVTVPVGVKTSSETAPLCYCFGFSKADVRSDLDRSGATEIPRRIAEGIRSGWCACEIMNPSGRCCLGEVRAFVKKLSRPA